MINFVQVVLLCRYNEVSLTNNLKMTMVKSLGNSESPALGIDSGNVDILLSTEGLLAWRTNQDD